MAPGHHLLVVTISLWGLLFLLHVDSVNSLWCKLCSISDSCDPENSIDVLCGADQRCATAVWFFDDGRTRIAARGCNSGPGITCINHPLVKKQGLFFCYTDRCNNQHNSSFNKEMTADYACFRRYP